MTETFEPIGRFAVGKRVRIISGHESYSPYTDKIYVIKSFVRGDHAILEGFGAMPLDDIELVKSL